MLSSAATGFAVLSGYIFAQKEIKNYRKFITKSFLNLAIPLFFTALSISIVVLVVVLKDYSISQYFDCWKGHRLYDNREVMLMDNVWYVPYIFLCYLVLPLLTKFYNKEKMGKILIPILIATELIASYFIGCPLVFSSFSFGFLISKSCSTRDMTYEEKNTVLDFIFPILIIILSTSLYILDVEAFEIGENYFVNRAIFLSQIVLRAIIASQVFTLFIKSFKFLNKIEKPIKVFNFTDKYCYYFFLTHEAFMTGVINFSSVSEKTIFAILICFPLWLHKTALNYIIIVIKPIGDCLWIMQYTAQEV